MDNPSFEKESDSERKPSTPPQDASDNQKTNSTKGILNPTKILHTLKLITIEPIIFLHMLSILMSNLVLNDIFFDRSCRVNLNYTSEVCDALQARQTENYTQEETIVQKSVAVITTWRFAIQYSVPALLVLILGSWSDTHGRKFPLILCMAGNVIQDVGLLLCLYFKGWSTTTVALFATIPTALTGSFPLFSMAFHSYLADTTPVRNLTLRFGVAGAFVSAGVSVGIAVGGFLISKVNLDFSQIIAIAGCIELVAVTTSLLFIQNTTSGSNKSDIESRKSDGTGHPSLGLLNFRHLLNAFKTILIRRKNHGRLKLLILLLVFVCSAAPAYGESAFIYLFLRFKFGWNAGQYGFFAMYQTIAGTVGVVLAIVILSYGLKVQDPFLGFYGCLSQISSCFMYAFAKSETMIYIAPIVDILNGAMTVTARSMTTKSVEPHEQGKIISVIAALDCVNPFVSNVMYSGLYWAVLESLPGAPFLLSAGLAIPPLIVFSRFSVLHIKNRNKMYT